MGLICQRQHEDARSSRPGGSRGCRSLLLRWIRIRRLRPEVLRIRTRWLLRWLLRKREAEGEPKAAADPYYYGGYGYGGYGLRSYGYGLGGYYGGYYGKREAEAEPKAAADPYYYGGYGYGGY